MNGIGESAWNTIRQAVKAKENILVKMNACDSYDIYKLREKEIHSINLTQPCNSKLKLYCETLDKMIENSRGLALTNELGVNGN